MDDLFTGLGIGAFFFLSFAGFALVLWVIDKGGKR